MHLSFLCVMRLFFIKKGERISESRQQIRNIAYHLLEVDRLYFSVFASDLNSFLFSRSPHLVQAPLCPAFPVRCPLSCALVHALACFCVWGHSHVDVVMLSWP